MQLFTERSAREAGLLKYGGRAGLEAAQGAKKRGKRKAAELAQAERWAVGEPAREARRAAREERLTAAAAKLEALQLQRLRGHPLIGGGPAAARQRRSWRRCCKAWWQRRPC